MAHGRELRIYLRLLICSALLGEEGELDWLKVRTAVLILV